MKQMPDPSFHAEALKRLGEFKRYSISIYLSQLLDLSTLVSYLRLEQFVGPALASPTSK